MHDVCAPGASVDEIQSDRCRLQTVTNYNVRYMHFVRLDADFRFGFFSVVLPRAPHAVHVNICDKWEELIAAIYSRWMCNSALSNQFSQHQTRDIAQPDTQARTQLKKQRDKTKPVSKYYTLPTFARRCVVPVPKRKALHECEAISASSSHGSHPSRSLPPMLACLSSLFMIHNDYYVLNFEWIHTFPIMPYYRMNMYLHGAYFISCECLRLNCMQSNMMLSMLGHIASLCVQIQCIRGGKEKAKPDEKRKTQSTIGGTCLQSALGTQLMPRVSCLILYHIRRYWRIAPHRERIWLNVAECSNARVQWSNSREFDIDNCADDTNKTQYSHVLNLLLGIIEEIIKLNKSTGYKLSVPHECWLGSGPI